MAQHIHCAVNNCHYWGSGNKCQASEIVVVSDRFGNSQPDTVDATQASSFPAASVSSCMETCCKTFVAKGSNQAQVDSVTKSQQGTTAQNATHRSPLH